MFPLINRNGGDGKWRNGVGDENSERKWREDAEDVKMGRDEG